MNIELRQRKFSVRLVKSCCQVVYGRQISRDAWSNWRLWSGVPKRSRLLTFDQFCGLVAISITRAAHPIRELRQSEIDAIATSLQVQEYVARQIALVDASGRVFGRDAAIGLSALGIDVSQRSLYRNVPGFSADRLYRIKDLADFAVV